MKTKLVFFLTGMIALNVLAYDFIEFESKLKVLIEKTKIEGVTKSGSEVIQLPKEEEKEVRYGTYELLKMLAKKDINELEKWLGETLTVSDGEVTEYVFKKNDVLNQIKKKEDDMKKRRRIYAVLFKEYKKSEPGFYQEWIKKALALDGKKMKKTEEFGIAKELDENYYYVRFLGSKGYLVFSIKKNEKNEWKLIEVAAEQY